MAKRHANRVGDLESMFLRLEELVLANSGEDEFEEIFKLLIAKLWDEHNGKTAFRVHDSECETYETINRLLKEANGAWAGILDSTESALTPEHLAVCVDALRRHTISDEGLEVLDGFFEFLVSRGAKGAKGQYFTPRHVVELCVRMLRPTEDETILDPACGSGGFLIHALNYVRSRHGIGGQDATGRYCESKLWGFDIDARAVRVAKALMVMAGDGNANIYRLNSLLRPDMVGLFAPEQDTEGPSSILTIEDVCRGRIRRHRGFDLILTNPPFAGEVRERHVLEGYVLASGKARMERDIIFIERCIQLLKPGGRMAIVLPHNKVAADSLGFVRQWLFRKARILAVVGLGRNTFLPHTHQKASVLFLEKCEPGRSDNYNIFFAISERDGKDSKGRFLTRDGQQDGSSWDRIDHDLGEIVAGFHEFCAAEGVHGEAH